MNNCQLAMTPLEVAPRSIDGLQVLRQIRGRWPRRRIVILAVFDDSQKVVRSVYAEISGYQLKTTKLPELAAAIRTALDDDAPMTPKVVRHLPELVPALAQKTDSGMGILTERECRILQLMADGLIKKEIAGQLDISIHTVSAHVRTIFEKLQVTTNTGAVAKALRKRLI